MSKKIIDLFCGAGGFSYGFEKEGFESILAIDKWDQAVETYNLNHKNKTAISMDIKEYDNKKIENLLQKNEVIGIIGGPPCQGFSMVGTRDSNDERNSLYLEYVRFVSTVKPLFFILENVKGLLSSGGGRDYLDYLSILDEAGYDLEWQVFNSKDYGVPQNRERIYTLGHLRRNGRRQVLPLSRESSSHLKQLVGGMQSYRVYDPSGIATTLVGEGGGLGAKTGLYLIDQSLTEPKLTEEARCITARYTAGATKRTAMNSGVLEVQPILTQGIKVRNGTKQGYQLAEVGDSVDLSYPSSLTRRARVGRGIAHNLSCSCQMGAVVWNGRVVKIRRLTPKECFRLQGFSDDLFEKAKAVNSDAQLYKQAGNGVTVPVVYAIGCAILSSKYHQK